MARLEINPKAKPATPPVTYVKQGTSLGFLGHRMMVVRTGAAEAMLIGISGVNKGSAFTWQKFPYTNALGTRGVPSDALDKYFGAGEYTILPD